jgi:hypothetical protein
MNRLKVLHAAIGLLSLAAVDAAWADDAPFAGRWRWNKTQSTIQQGEPLPKDIVTEIASAQATRIAWTVTVTDPSDQKHVQKFDGPADGQPHPVQGSNDGTTAAFTLANGALQAVFRNPGGQADSVSCTVSPDRTKMTCKGSVSDGKHPPETYTDVYDRL